MSQNATDLHFGLGPAARIEKIEVLWPGGKKTLLHGEAVDRTITVREPSDAATK